ncbi:hypothetical protein [Streptomyces sp. NPDC101132]|uniref:hypothetical protein n=1 Tax=Streptomyces sp. NPDC101132 TaxID=3366110 RepID=UPI0038000CCB
MSTSYRRRILAGAGALTLALGGVAGLTGTAQAATKTTTIFMDCDAPAPQTDGSGNQDFTITLPDTAKAGDTVPVTIDPGPSPLVPAFAVTTENTTKITFVGVPGQPITVTSPKETVTVTPGVPLDAKPFTANLTIPDGTEGTTIDFKMDLAVTVANLGGMDYVTTCTPQPRPSATVGSIAVEALPKDPVTTKLSPNSGGPNTAVVATGANFPPGAVTCAASLAGVDTGDTGTGTADASGAASCSLTVTKKADKIRIGSTAGKPFSYIAPVEGVPHPVDIEVLPGPLALGPTAGLPTLDFGAITINGKKQSVVGAFNAATVQDFRGGTLGWDLTVTRTPFLNSSTGHSLAAGLGIQPSCTVTNPDSPSPCVAGAPGAITDVPLKVASQAAGGDDLTGGEFAVGGGAMIQLPAFMFADTYQSVVTFSIA